MRQAFKFRIDPSAAVEQKLTATLNICRELYNAGLRAIRFPERNYSGMGAWINDP